MAIISDLGGTTQNSFSLNGKVTLFQGDEIPSDLMGNNGDVYFKSEGIIYVKRNDTWFACTHPESLKWLPDPRVNPDSFLYSDGETYENTINLKYDQDSYETLNIKNTETSHDEVGNINTRKCLGFIDKNDILEGYLEFAHNITSDTTLALHNSRYTAMNVCKNGTTTGTLAVGIDENDNVFSRTVQPRENPTSDEIATIGWVEKNVAGMKLGQTIWSSVPLDDIGIALMNGQKLTKASYPQFYNFILKLFNNSANIVIDTNLTSDFIERTANSSYGYYYINRTAECIWIPDYSTIMTLSPTTNSALLGQYLPAGVPNIIGAEYGLFTTNTPSSSGALYHTDTGNKFNVTTSSGSAHEYSQINLDASRANAIYGRSNTVQPESVKTFVYVVISNGITGDIGSVDINALITEINNYQNMVASLNNRVINCENSISSVTTRVSNCESSISTLNNKFSYGTNWMKDNQSGFIIQWGQIALAGDNMTTTVALNIPFSSANYSIFLTPVVSGSTSDFYDSQVQGQNTTGFWFYKRCRDTWNGGYTYWVAMGY